MDWNEPPGNLTDQQWNEWKETRYWEKQREENQAAYARMDADRRQQEMLAEMARPKTFAQAIYSFWRSLVGFVALILICALSVLAQIFQILWNRLTEALGSMWWLQELPHESREKIALYVLIFGPMIVFYAVVLFWAWLKSRTRTSISLRSNRNWRR